jgi:hypothetical protein
MKNRNKGAEELMKYKDKERKIYVRFPGLIVSHVVNDPDTGFPLLSSLCPRKHTYVALKYGDVACSKILLNLRYVNTSCDFI